MVNLHCIPQYKSAAHQVNSSWLVRTTSRSSSEASSGSMIRSFWRSPASTRKLRTRPHFAESNGCLHARARVRQGRWITALRRDVVRCGETCDVWHIFAHSLFLDPVELDVIRRRVDHGCLGERHAVVTNPTAANREERGGVFGVGDGPWSWGRRRGRGGWRGCDRGGEPPLPMYPPTSTPSTSARRLVMVRCWFDWRTVPTHQDWLLCRSDCCSAQLFRRGKSAVLCWLLKLESSEWASSFRWNLDGK
jgi:hypothetical protein